MPALCPLLAAALLACATPQDSRAASAPAARPRLLVVVVIDQMIPEQLDRLAPFFSGGLARFARDGRIYTDCELPYIPTLTAPGHATLSTGVTPALHGVLANERTFEAERTTRATVLDPQALRTVAQPLTDAQRKGAASGRVLRAPGLAEHLRAIDPLAKSFGISSKDRSAILLSGQHADLALWWDGGSGGFGTSDWYTSELPHWVAEWNRGWYARLRPDGQPWVWTDSCPEGVTAAGTAPDEQEGENPRFLGGRSFPHSAPALPAEPKSSDLARAGDFAYQSPCCDAFCAELAGIALDELELGRDEHPDLLAISLSGCDIVGHQMGPYSREVTDLLLRADRALGELFAHIDERVGAGRWIAALSADHGVMDLPERLAAQGKPAQRIAFKDQKKLQSALQSAAAEAGAPDSILRFDGFGLYLARTELAAKGVDLPKLRAALAQAWKGANELVASVWTLDQLRAIAKGEAPAADEAQQLAAASFDEQFSPDVGAIYQPYTLLAGSTGTTHGSANRYDRRVPMVLLGPGFAPGRVAGEVHNVDLVPTLIRALGGSPGPGLAGHALP